MKLSLFSTSLALLTSSVLAAPTPTENEVEGAHIVKRASITDVATLGYATQNGGFVILSLSPRYNSLLPGS